MLLVSGFGTHWDGEPDHLLGKHFDERRFSYRGTGSDGRPLPFEERDTHKSLRQLARLMDRQVAAFYRDTGQPVSIVAESEGSLVAKVYLAGTPAAPVTELVLLSPLVRPARVYYPRAGEPGWGLAGGWVLRGLAAGIRSLSTMDVEIDTPLLHSMVDNAPIIRDLLPCPLDGIHQLALFPLADAVVAFHPTAVGIPSKVVPAYHGGLLGNDEIDKAIALQLDRGSVPRFNVWSRAQRLIEAASSAWQVPPLPLTLNDAWGAGAREPSCEMTTAALRDWLR